MMRYGIPEYRLPRDILDKEIAGIEASGVHIETNTRVDSLDGVLQKDYQAIFLATGAHKGVGLGIAGEDNPGVIEGVSFLREVSLGREIKLGNRVANQEL